MMGGVINFMEGIQRVNMLENGVQSSLYIENFIGL